MARIRAIKPEFSFDEELAALPPLTQLFYALLWCHMDREGRGEDKPGKLRALIFPYHPERDADKILNELAPKFVVRYEVEGRRYIEVQNWEKHQKPHSTEVPSKIPPPPLDNAGLTQALVRKKTQEDSGEEEGEESGKGECAGAKAPPPPSVLDFPCVGKIKTWSLSAEKVAEYKATYPGVEPLTECRRAWQWCQDNPARRKTARGMPAFLSRWLGRAQDRGGARLGPAAIAPPDEAGPYRIADEAHRLICFYKTVIGVKMDDRAWDKNMLTPYLKEDAKGILDAFNGIGKEAALFLDEFAANMKKAGRQWTLRTVKEHAWRTRGERPQREIGAPPAETLMAAEEHFEGGAHGR